MAPVIVFGPTGQIGSFVALTAAEHGAEVWLAMRDPSKSIPVLEQASNTIKDGTFHRVRADVTDFESVSQAVKSSGATRAFVYLARQKDHMRGTFQALKSAGVEFVVFVSSFTVEIDKPPQDIAPTEVIPYVHAQAEANLDEIFGVDHNVALRPGAFASNLSRFAKGIAAGEVILHGGGFTQDNIVPADIGRVGGTILVSGAKEGQKEVYLYGPNRMSMHDGILKIGEILRKDVNITPQSDEDAYEQSLNNGMPEPLAKYLVKVHSTEGVDKGDGSLFPKYDEGVANVKLYTGRPATPLEGWIKDNVSQLQAKY